MKQILCFGDSNTWGYDGESKKRLPWGKRWTSLLQEKFDVESQKYDIAEETEKNIDSVDKTSDKAHGEEKKINKENVRIIEEGLCGRTTIFEDPLRDGRRGTALLPTLLETHDGVDTVVLMLGTNDCKTVFGASAEVIGKGIARLLEQIQAYAPDAKVLLISPIYLGEKVWQEGYDQEFSQDSVQVSKDLEKVYERIAREKHVEFMRAASYVKCCDADQEHMNAAGHVVFAKAVYEKLMQLAA
ncbi:GDSL-type esterase/lipase family protein [Blautia sp. HCP3S3_H10_1]|uniref:GDSL-type esterase/lipase family protein n=1 Tax=unclassified Blautia TaxID=2648079 RepID=UPI003F8EB475|nr:GDSL-type esterase/lipase family protein [Clostridia bacterium]